MRHAPEALSSLLDLREQIFGSGLPLTKSRFLFEVVGNTYLLRWDSVSGYRRVFLYAASAPILIEYSYYSFS